MSTLEGQLRRVYAQYTEQTSDLRKWVVLANLRDRNEVLYYRLLSTWVNGDLRSVSTTVAIAVATTGAAEGHARVDLHNPLQQVTEAMWRIQYPHLDLTDETI